MSAAREKGQERMVEIRVDGLDVEVPERFTILDACNTAGVEVPTLCFLEGMTPANACRICVVEMEGSRVLVPACSRRVEPKMVVKTDTPRVRLARKMVMEFLASSVDLSLSPRAQEYIERYDARPERYGGNGKDGPEISAPATVAQPVKVDNPLYVRDLSRCILCYRC